jgi:hypothetical protein
MVLLVITSCVLHGMLACVTVVGSTHNCTCSNATSCSSHGTCSVDGRSCSCVAGWSGAHCEIQSRCPAGATVVAGSNYCSPLVGTCVGLGGSHDDVNGKHRMGIVVRPACQAFCDATPACVGYVYYAATGYCNVFGPGVDHDLGGGWHNDTHPTTIIAGASGTQGFECVAMAGRN